MPKKQKKKTVSREIGLEIGAICGKHFLKLEHLHYGYWTDGLDVDIFNLHIAQDNYVNFLISHIPEGTKTILDVGCGMGQISRKLIDKGYTVDCVSPSAYLAECARKLLGDETTIFECFYEQLETDKRYDVVLFSESFQYIPPKDAVEKSLSILNPGGHLLICDVFQTEAEGKCDISGGHRLIRFNEVMAAVDSLELITDLDITDKTAPTIDIECGLFREVGLPVMDLVIKLLDSRYRLISKFIQWKFKKKISRLRNKYLGGDRTGDNFKKFKSYRLFLYKKKNK
ncbi:MAG: class I SAM-dependent methyltransferase [Planctomycetota bacterium]|jgi:2-polyprenyl-3-methyl-5-hydroxy-6-metoxy-1,4-benzoquinol methylase